MKDEQREELKELVRREPGLRETFDTVSAEHTAAATHTKTLADKRASLRRELDEIDAAKTELAKAGSSPKKTADKKPAKKASAPADKK